VEANWESAEIISFGIIDDHLAVAIYEECSRRRYGNSGHPLYFSRSLAGWDTNFPEKSAIFIEHPNPAVLGIKNINVAFGICIHPEKSGYRLATSDDYL